MTTETTKRVPAVTATIDGYVLTFTGDNGEEVSLDAAPRVLGLTKAINGGTNGLEDRRRRTAQAKELILLADHSKVGQASRVTYASLADVGTLVTDAGARALPAFSALQAAGCHIVVA